MQFCEMVRVVSIRFLLGGGESAIFLKGILQEDFRHQGGKLMTPNVQQTRYGDTIFVSHPSHAARALVTWAVLIHGHSMHSIETLGDGCVRVDIPGLTSITFAQESIMDD